MSDSEVWVFMLMFCALFQLVPCLLLCLRVSSIVSE